MPRWIDGRANPFALLPEALECRLSGNVLTVSGAWEDWRRGLERTVRKELERSLRVFERSSGARFIRARDPIEGQLILGELARMQRERIAALGLPYALDERPNAQFYERLIAAGLGSGGAVVTALEAEGEVIAALLGVASGDHYAMVRLGQAGGRWRNCSPGRLIIDQTIRALREQGYRHFDFTTGDYDYKRRLQAQRIPLVDYVAPLSWRGLPSWGVTTAKSRLRRSPGLKRAVKGAAIAARLCSVGVVAQDLLAFAAA